jgi:hypothetical protein
VSCHFSVQRRVQVSIALDVAAASNGNLKTTNNTRDGGEK